MVVRRSLFKLGIQLIALLMAAVALAQPVDIPASNTDDNSTLIRFRHVVFDPLDNTQPQRLSAKLGTRHGKVESAIDVACYLVQFSAGISAEARREVVSLGAEIRAYIPDNTVVACMTGDVEKAVADSSYIRWTGAFDARYKIQSEVIDRLVEGKPARGTRRYSILLHDSTAGSQSAVADRIESAGGEIHQIGGRIIEATIDDRLLVEVANLNEVFYIDRWLPVSEHVDQVRADGIGGFNFVESMAGYTGQGVRGEVRDDGLRTTHQDFQANLPIGHTTAGNDAFNYPGTPDPGDDVTEPYDHGTRVYGTLFGSGTGDGKSRGLLPDAQPIFASRFFDADEVTQYGELVDPAGPFRAVFQSNSFGANSPNYTTRTFERDDAVYQHDLIVTQSMGNSSDQLEASPRGWAKNGVSVGGIDPQDTLSRNDDSWASGGGSIGPAADGRIKPELSHFYRDGYTTGYSSDDAYVDDMNGTSYATPLVAGHFGLLFQMWADGVFDPVGPGQARDVFDARPHAATARALIINTAFQYPFIGLDHDKGRFHQGWGMPDVGNLYRTARKHGWNLPVLVDESAPLAPAGVHSYTVNSDGSSPLKVTLVYKDPPGAPAASQHRVNDLSLRVTSPSNIVYWGNHGLTVSPWSISGGSSDTINTVENIFVGSPEIGTWSIAVLGDEIVEDSHPATADLDAVYALVATGGTGGMPTDHFVEAQVSDAADNAQESSDGTVSTGTTGGLRLGDDATGQIIVGTRFNGISVPAGATISRAYVQFETRTPNREAADLVVEGEANDTAAPYSSNNNALSVRPRTSTAVSWSVPDWVRADEQSLDQRTPDLSAIIQEIVDRPGWQSGNSLSLFYTGTGIRVAESFDSDAGDAPLLYIEFDDGTPASANVAPLVSTEIGQGHAIGIADSLSLAGVAVDDGLPDSPGELSINWTSVNGPGTVTFSDPIAPSTTASFSAPGTYTLRLTADDGEFSRSDDAVVDVLAAGVMQATYRITVSSSDAEEDSSSGDVTTDSSDLELVEDGGDQQIVGVRFRDISIPQGSSILSAYVQFQADESDSDTTSLAIAGDATDNSASFTTTARDISSRSQTSATVAWGLIPPWNEGEAGMDQRTPELASIVQEVVDRPGWTQGNAIGFLISGSGSRTAESSDGNASAAPALIVRYQAAVAPPPPPPPPPAPPPGPAPSGGGGGGAFGFLLLGLLLVFRVAGRSLPLNNRHTV